MRVKASIVRRSRLPGLEEKIRVQMSENIGPSKSVLWIEKGKDCGGQRAAELAWERFKESSKAASGIQLGVRTGDELIRSCSDLAHEWPQKLFVEELPCLFAVQCGTELA